MIFRPFHYWDIGCAAYVFGCGTVGKCAVVDPRADDITTYAEFARSKKMRITHVIDTHVHADHRSGGPKLAAATGAKYCLHRSADVALPFEPLEDEQTIELGNTVVRVLHTPGHTPESICLLVSDLRRAPDPWFLMTGDTMFVGAVGRPDLPGHAREHAATMHESIRRKLLVLPETLEIYPAHFAGSACGVGMSGKPTTTIAFEKRWNPKLSMDRDQFIADVVGSSPAKPPEMEAILLFNRGRAE